MFLRLISGKLKDLCKLQICCLSQRIKGFRDASVSIFLKNIDLYFLQFISIVKLESICFNNCKTNSVLLSNKFTTL